MGERRGAVRFVLVGGFLGAGKTTALLRLAGRYAARGKRVAIITNDQAQGLVDSLTFRAAGFATEEVPNGCFCCRFDELIAAAGRLEDGVRPDLLLAEPVGSCTDLVATVVRPLRRLYGDRFSTAPYVALLDPDRAERALTGRGPAGFSAKVTYLFEMQQHEADAVVLNKVDLLDPQRLARLCALVSRNFAKAELLTLSARTGEGFDALEEFLERDAAPGGLRGDVPEVDYAAYAEAEAQLGWCDATLELSHPSGLEADRFLVGLVAEVGRRLARSQSEPAHVKMTIQAPEGIAVANLVAGDRAPELSLRSGATVRSATLVINARVECPPDALRETIREAVAAVTLREGLSVRWLALRDLSPAPPVPTHRLR